jgi:hypothetical protein
VAELSLIDADGKRQPANAWAVATPVMKAQYEKAKLEYPVIPSEQDDNANTTANDPDKCAQDAGKASNTQASGLGAVKTTNLQGVNAMEDKDIEALVEAKFKARQDAESAALKVETEKAEAIKAGVAKEIEAMKAEAAKGRRLPFLDSVTIAKNSEIWKYDNMDAGDLAVMLGTLHSGNKSISTNALKALAVKLEEDKSETGEVGRRAMKSAGIKADEVGTSTTSSYGDNWVGVAYSTSLWESIRVGAWVVGKLPNVEVPQGMESITLPLESTDPTWYMVNQATTYISSLPEATITSSRLGTSNVSLTLGKLGARVMWSGELDEDSLIPFAPQLRQQLAVSGAEYLESAIIDGDTSTTSLTNINHYYAALTNDEYFLIFNGLRHSPLEVTSANSRAGGSLTVEDYLETVKLMGGAGINAIDTSKVGFIIDPSVNYKTLALPELLSRDVYGQPTIEGGKLTNIWGYEVRVSGSMCKMQTNRLSDSLGHINEYTDGNNIYGSILAVRWDQWKFGWKRRMTMETTRIARSDVTEIVAMLRCGLIQRDTEAAAITYAISV